MADDNRDFEQHRAGMRRPGGIRQLIKDVQLSGTGPAYVPPSAFGPPDRSASGDGTARIPLLSDAWEYMNHPIEGDGTAFTPPGLFGPPNRSASGDGTARIPLLSDAWDAIAGFKDAPFSGSGPAYTPPGLFGPPDRSASGDGTRPARVPLLSDAYDDITGAVAVPSNEEFVDAYADQHFTARPRREWQDGSAPKQQAVEFPAPSSRLHLPGVGRPTSLEEYLETIKPQVTAETARMARFGTMRAPPTRMPTPAQAVGRADKMIRQPPPGIPGLQPHNFRRDQLQFPTTPEQVADAEAAKRNERLLSLKPQVEFPEEAPPREGDDSMGRLFERSAANGFPVSAAPPGTVGPAPRRIGQPTLSSAAAEQERDRRGTMDALAEELGVGPGSTVDPVAYQGERFLRQRGLIQSEPGVPQLDFPLRGRPDEPGAPGRRLAALAETAKGIREQAEEAERAKALAEAAEEAKRQRAAEEAAVAARKAEDEAARMAAAEERRKRDPVAGIGGVMIDPVERAGADVDIDGRYRGPKGSRAAPFALSAKDLGDITGGQVEDFSGLGGEGLRIDYGMLADKMGLPADMPADEREERAKVFLGDQISRSKNSEVREARGGGSYFTPSEEAREGYESRSMAVEASKIKKTWPTMSPEASAALDEAVKNGDRRALGAIRRQLYDDQNMQAGAYIRDRNSAAATGRNLLDPAIRAGMFLRSMGEAETPQDQAQVYRQFGDPFSAAGIDATVAAERGSLNTLAGVRATADAGVAAATAKADAEKAAAESGARAAADTAKAALAQEGAKRAAAERESEADRKTQWDIVNANNAAAQKRAETPEPPAPLLGDQARQMLEKISGGLISNPGGDPQQVLNQYVHNIKQLGIASQMDDRALTKLARTELIRSVLGRTDALKNPSVLALIEQHVAESFPSPVQSYLSNPLGQSGAERAAQEFQKEMAALGIEPSNAQTAELYKYLWNRRTSRR